jgi:hypothetical protein
LGGPVFSRLRPSRGLGEPALEVLVGSTARHGCLRCLLYFKQTLGDPLTRVPSLEGRYCLEPGARAARGFYVAWVPAVPVLHQAGPGRPSHVDIPSRAAFVLSQGLVPLEGFTWHGYPRRLLYIKQAPGGLLTSISHRGPSLLRARGPPRSRVLLARQGTQLLNASQSRPRFCSAGAPF